MEVEEELGSFYQAGQLDSSGHFTVDYERLIPTLAQHQFKSADRVPLRLLAAAVEAGATWFEVRGDHFTWDAVHRLDAVNELTIALHSAAAMKARVRAESGRESLSLQAGKADHGVCAREGTSVELRWGGWLPRRVRLGAEAFWAPLDLRGVRVARPEALVRLGSPPLALSCPRAMDGGNGYVFVGTRLGRVLLIVHGVAYPGPPLAKGLGAVWWDDTLALDLGREKLVEDDHLRAVLEDVLTRVAEAVVEEPTCRDWLLREAARVPRAELFEMTDRSRLSYRDLRRLFHQQGYLATGPEGLAAHPALEKLFPLVLAYGKGPRLPEDEVYLTRVPLRGGAGELGLREGDTFRWSAGDRPLQTLHSAPFRGVDAICGDGQFFRGLPDLYRALLNQRFGAGDADRIRPHLVEAWKLTSDFKGSAWRGHPHHWSHPEIREVARRVTFPLWHGGTVSLAELSGTTAFYVGREKLHDGTPPPDTVVLESRAQTLFPTLTTLRSFSVMSGWTEPAQEFLGGRPVDPLRFLYLATNSSASRALQTHLPKAPSRSGPSVDGLWLQAIDIARRQGAELIGSDHVLWVLLDHQDIPGVRAMLIGSRGQEQAQYALKMMRADGKAESPVWRHRYASALRDQGRAAEALEVLRDCLQHPWDQHLTALGLGVTTHLLGRFDEALHWYQQCRHEAGNQRHYDATALNVLKCYTHTAEAAVQLDLRNVPAAVDCLEKGDEFILPEAAYRKVVGARLALWQDRPDLALQLVDEVLTSQDHRFSSSLFEYQAMALRRLDRLDEARAADERFVRECELHGLPEFDATARIVAARHRLAGRL